MGKQGDHGAGGGLAERRGLDGSVYEPAEDSALLVEGCAGAIGEDELVIDVGTGSGYVAERIRARSGARVIGTDRNPHACRRAAERGVQVVLTDLLAGVRPAIADVIVCNPPYLPTDAVPRDDWLAVAVAGGPTGRAVVERLFADAGRVLVDDGRIYLLVSSLMDIPTLREEAAARGFDAVEVARDDSYPYEVLAVLECRRHDRG